MSEIEEMVEQALLAAPGLFGAAIGGLIVGGLFWLGSVLF